MELPSEAVIAGLVLAFLVVVHILRSARSRGVFGELRVRATLFLRLDRNAYRSFHNLTLPTRDGTTQIDHVVVSRSGVFVIETKNLTGWIFGDERSRKWTQSIYGNRYQFPNPLRQNYKHLKAVEALVGLGPRCLHSVVVFLGGSRFKTVVPPNVLKRRALVAYIRSKTDILLSDKQVEDVIRILETSVPPRFGARRRHLRNRRENQRSPVCPRCGEAMVLRTARRGPNPGGQFWGCPRYPQCTFTRDIGHTNWRVIGVVLIAAAVTTGCEREEPQATEVTRSNPIVPLDSGWIQIETADDTIRLNVEIAETPEQKSAGLMERRVLPDSEGMLFMYGDEQAPSDPFYMFRTRIPLDIAFMDSTGQVVAIRQMEPCSSPEPQWCERYPPGVPYHAALEVNLGFLEEHGIGIGDRVRLVETFGS